MASEDELLETVARDSTMDYSNWPGLLDRILPRLDYIIHNNFPIPSIPLPEPIKVLPSNDDAPRANAERQSGSQEASSQNSSKENAPPDSFKRHPSIPFSQSDSFPPDTQLVTDSQTSSISVPAGSIPPQLMALFSSIKSTLKSSFSTAPPHTIQRFAELILHPTDHYRTLPSYLRALDRVISVSSTAETFPLPSVGPTGLENGGNGESASFLAPGAPQLPLEQDFNGAALTRIPWLRDPIPTLDRPLASAPDLRTESTSLIDGPNGAGSLETVVVSVNGGTGSILRSDVQEPINQSIAHSPGAAPGRITRSSTAAAAAATRQEEEADEEMVHARGPDEIGMEDMGPQAIDRTSGTFDVEAALGRKGEGERLEPARIAGGEERDADANMLAEDINGASRESSATVLGDGESRNRTSEGGEIVDTSAL